MEEVKDAIDFIRQKAHRWREDRYLLLEWIGDSKFVLIGEGSHGTHEFYKERAELTKWLIQEKGFSVGYAASVELDAPCRKEVVRQLMELRQQASYYKSLDGQLAAYEFFSAEQNARIIKNAEEYYRALFSREESSWNERDRHMAETLDAIVGHLSQRNSSVKVVVWAHNSHIGDARATEYSKKKEITLGQLVRQRYPTETKLIGQMTYQGFVTAASDWGGPAEHKQVLKALPDSFEALLHKCNLNSFFLLFSEDEKLKELLSKSYLERAIGVVYLPHRERFSHYFHAQLANQFDAVIFFDKTHAVEPLDKTSTWNQTELPDTYPTGI
jgi:erythromycin esterase-like protein